MPAHVPPVRRARGLVAYVAQQLDAFRSVSFGLTDEQARLHPDRRAPCRSAPAQARHRVQRAGSPVALPRPAAPRRAAVRGAGRRLPGRLGLRDDDTIAAALAALRRGDRPGHRRPPRPTPTRRARCRRRRGSPRDVEAWSVRWVLLHLDRGDGPARRPRRHRPRGARRRDDVRAGRRPGGLARDRLAEAVASDDPGLSIRVRPAASTSGSAFATGRCRRPPR